MTAKKSQSTHNLPGIFEIPPILTHNHLYYGDNLTIMRTMPNACVDLIYLDPPFNSQRNYNLIYKRLTGLPVPEQEEAFCDAWDMDPEKEEMARKMPIVLREYGVDEDIVLFWQAWITALRHTQPRLLAYLVYMSYRLFEMRRILKSNGSVYLHCDPNASHYIKVIMDGVFGHQNFRNEIIWKRTHAHSGGKKLGAVHDVILCYGKSDKYIWNTQRVEYSEKYVDTFFRFKDANGKPYRATILTGSGTRTGSSGKPWRGIDPTASGRHWAIPGYVRPLLGDHEFSDVQSALDELDKIGRILWPAKTGGIPSFKQYQDDMKGTELQDVWTDIPPISAQAKERLGYPTQKPIELLQRIIRMSSNPNDVVFDPFCGCGTSVYASHLLGRKWIGCDIAILSVQLVRDVLLKRYGLEEGKQYHISGVPLSLEGARDLFDRDPRQFQHWAVELAGGFASTKHSDDKGIDGRIHFETKDGLRNMILSVKGGKLTPAFMRELRGTMERETGTEMGGFICLQEPTKGMLLEAANAGMYEYLGKEYQRLQIRTAQDLLDGKGFDTPSKIQTLDWTNQAVMPI